VTAKETAAHYSAEFRERAVRLATKSPRQQVGDGSNPGAPPPPAVYRAALSATLRVALSGRFPGAFGADLLTGLRRGMAKIALRRPILSGPADLAD
jgi:hypothetical protein